MLILIAAAVLAVAGIATGLAVTFSSAGAITARGAMEVDDFGGQCLSDPGFSDITSGTQVTVTDPGGTVIAVSSLSYDEHDSALQSGLQLGLSVCIYDFTVSVPAGLPRYGIAVSHRGTVWFTAAQMAKGPGLSLSSGGSGF